MSRVGWTGGGYQNDAAAVSVLIGTGYDEVPADPVVAHVHSESDTTNLVSDLAGKSATTHTHTGVVEVVATWYVSGSLSAASFAQAIPVDKTYALTGVRLAVGTAPVGAAILVDVNKGGTTIFTTQGNRPTIADGATSGGPGTAPNVTAVAAGDLLTIDVDQVGSGTAGSDLTVRLLGTRTVG